MIFPTKHENLEKNLLVLGSDIIYILKKDKQNIEDLFQKIKVKKNASLDQFYNTITFLWLSDIIDQDNFSIKLKK